MDTEKLTDERIEAIWNVIDAFENIEQIMMKNHDFFVPNIDDPEFNEKFAYLDHEIEDLKNAMRNKYGMMIGSRKDFDLEG